MKKRKIFTLVNKIEEIFMKKLKNKLNLEEIKGPLYLEKESGLNDDLSESETPIEFSNDGKTFQVVQSLAKWKRHALKEYEYDKHEGIVIKMNALRQDENDESKYHSLHVDQYDWEKVILKEDRTIDFLKEQVRKIYSAILETKIEIGKMKTLKYDLPKEITFITSQELLNKYPDLSPEKREQEFCKIHKAIFVIGVGKKLSDGRRQGDRAPDYDDWDLNGDIIMYDHTNESMIELSSMGIRVDKDKMISQHSELNVNHKLTRQFHKDVMSNKLPLSIGGGIGISRLNMFILELKNIHEVK